MIEKGIQIFFNNFEKNLELIQAENDAERMRQRAQVMAAQIGFFRSACLDKDAPAKFTDLFAINELLDVREIESFFQWLLNTQKTFEVAYCLYRSELSKWRVYAGEPPENLIHQSIEWVEKGKFGKKELQGQLFFYFFAAGELRLVFGGSSQLDINLSLFLKLVGSVFPRIAPKFKDTNQRLSKKFGMIAVDEKSLALMAQLKKAASTDVTILLEGASGTGKEVLANFIHRSSVREKRNFVAVNCAAIPDGLIESELFGHEKGAFTGAVQRHIGQVELADQGTLFLDEIGEMDPKAQAKLLRFLQLKEFHRVGGKEKITVDVRIIAATNRDLRKAIEEQTFRDDLYFRLSVMPFKIALLKDRPGDLVPLFHHFLGHYARQFNLPLPSVSQNVYNCLFEHSFPGNIRELENLVQNVLVQSHGEKITCDHLPAHILGNPDAPALKNTPLPGDEKNDQLTGSEGRGLTDHEYQAGSRPLPKTNDELKEQKLQIQENSRLEQLKLEKAFLLKLFEETGWVIPEASKKSGINRTMLYKMMERNGIKP